MQKRIPYSSFDHTLISVVKELFKKLYNRRMLIRLIGVRFTHLVHGTQQLDLFEDTPELVNLYLSLDRIRKRYGKEGIKRAIGKLDSKPKKEVEEIQAIKELHKQLKTNDSTSLPHNPPIGGLSASGRNWFHSISVRPKC